MWNRSIYSTKCSVTSDERTLEPWRQWVVVPPVSTADRALMLCRLGRLTYLDVNAAMLIVNGYDRWTQHRNTVVCSITLLQTMWLWNGANLKNARTLYYCGSFVWLERVQMKHCKYLCVVYNEHWRDIVLKYVLIIVNSTYGNGDECTVIG